MCIRDSTYTGRRVPAGKPQHPLRQRVFGRTEGNACVAGGGLAELKVRYYPGVRCQRVVPGCSVAWEFHARRGGVDVVGRRKL